MLTAAADRAASPAIYVAGLGIHAHRAAQRAAVRTRAFAGHAGLGIGAHRVARTAVARAGLQIYARARARAEPRATARGFRLADALVAQRISSTRGGAIAAMDAV